MVRNNEGIDKQTDHSDDALIVRLLHVCHSVCVRSRAHTGFVGEQAALDALADSGLERVAEAAADDCIRLERVPKIMPKVSGMNLMRVMRTAKPPRM